MKFTYILISLIIGLNTFITVNAEAPTADLPDPTSTELVDFYFDKDANIMMAIAECESSQTQFKEDGTVVKSPTLDYGFLQINHNWDSTAKKLGLDYKGSLHDNIKMAKYIKDKQGLKAWTTYRNGCYKKYL